MDIGTDKVSAATRSAVRHHLIDVFDVNSVYSAGDFVAHATEAIADIVSRGKTPIVVGGTAFYLHMLMQGMPGTPPNSDEARSKVGLMIGIIMMMMMMMM